MMLVFIFLLFSSLSLAAEEIYLQFLPNTAVESSCHLSSNLMYDIKEKKLASNHQQEFTVIMRVLNDQADLPVTHFPITVSINFKSFKWSMDVNGQAMNYDSAQPGTNAVAAQFARLIDRPFKITLEKSGLSLFHSPELKLLMNELPVLRDWKFENVLENFLSAFFGFAGQPLETKRNYTSSFHDSLFPEMTVHVNAIDEGLIQAHFLPENGVSNGTVTWNRHQALMMELQSETTLEGIRQQPMRGNVHVSISSKLVK